MSFNRSPLVLGALAMATMLLVAGCTAGPFGDEMDSEEITQQVQDRHEEIDDLQGVMTVETTIGNETQETTMEFWQRLPDQQRTEVRNSTGPESEGDVTVTDGETSWYYDSAANEVTRFDLDIDEEAAQINESAIIESMLEDYDVAYDGTETVGDRTTHVLELTPTGDDGNETVAYDSLTLWVDDEYWYPVKQHAEMTVGNQTTETTITYEELAINEGVDDERFTFDPPEDAEIVEPELPETQEFDDVAGADSATPFDIAEPEVPDGYALDRATVAETDGTTSATLWYENDGDGTLFVGVSDDESMTATADGEPVEIGDHEGTVVETMGTTTVRWECDGLSYSVTGDLDRADLIAVAESVPCE